MAGKICQICGEKSGIYPLCKKHLEMKAQGEVVKNEETGKWELKENLTKTTKNCLLCGKEISNIYDFCKDCNKAVKNRMEDLDKNQYPTELKDYYFNAKDYALRSYDDEKIEYQKLTMSAISTCLRDLYDDETIYNRLSKDIKTINEYVSNKNKNLTEKLKNKEKIEEVKINKELSQPKTKKTQDGHFVGSELEITVDDILYNSGIIHAYAVKVVEIFERTVTCDWYIPIVPGRGIYIELWGVQGNEKYNKNKEEKIELYQKHKIPLIEITYDLIKGDTQRLTAYIKQEIKKKTREILSD